MALKKITYHKLKCSEKAKIIGEISILFKLNTNSSDCVSCCHKLLLIVAFAYYY